MAEPTVVGPEYAEGIRAAAQVVHAEARWQEEQFVRGTPIEQNPRLEMRDRLLLVERALLSLAAVVEPAVPRG